RTLWDRQKCNGAGRFEEKFVDTGGTSRPVDQSGSIVSAITLDSARTTRHPGYEISQRKRKLVEQAFGLMKTVGLLRKLRHRGGELVDWIFTFTAAAYNIVRLRTLLAAEA